MKKIFISSDIEGVSDLSHWDEANKDHSDYAEFKKIMTSEVKQICETLSDAREIYVRDAHSSARNIIHSELPLNTSLIRGFNGHINQMMMGVDNKGIDFAILHGYHAAAGSSESPLAHTHSSKKIHEFTINGKLAGEVTLSIYNAALYGVPVCYICGDAAAVVEAQDLNKNIIGTATKYGIGSSVVSKHPDVVLGKITKDLSKAIKLYESNPSACEVKLPKNFDIVISYKDHALAYKNSFYPGAKFVAPNKIHFISKDFIEVLRCISFCM